MMISQDSDMIDSELMSQDEEVLDSEVSASDSERNASQSGDAAAATDPGRRKGSTLPGAIFNFTNSIIGAGCIGLGGAIAVSGGVISIVLIICFGALTKISLDMVIRLSVETEGARGSYEDLARVAIGPFGRMVVLGCKFLYSFGCLVAYIIVIKDNSASAIRNLLFGSSHHHDHNHQQQLQHDGTNHFVDFVHTVLKDDGVTTWILSSAIILPLCLLRDMTPLSNLSMFSIVSMMSIVGIVIYIFFAHPELHETGGSVFVNWFEIRPGVLESLGTFVFTFVSQHTVHLVYGSIRSDIRTVSNWKIVSTAALTVSSVVSLSVGVFVYMTFWDKTQSDIFAIYPDSWLIDLAKLLLCITMLFTFPLPFFTCRELIIVMFIHPFCKRNPMRSNGITADESNDLREPLIVTHSNDAEVGIGNSHRNAITASSNGNNNDEMSLSTTLSRLIHANAAPSKWLLPDDDRQLQLVGHIVMTAKLWFVTTVLAIASPSLGDILDLVGCASGTMIAFILPGLISFRIEGYSHIAMLVSLVGGLVGTVGTYFSIRKLFSDMI